MIRRVLWALTVLTLSTSFAAGQEYLTEREREMIRRLETTRLTMDFNDAPLPEVIDFLRDVTNVDIIIDPTVLREQGDVRSSLKVKDIPAANALNLLLGLSGLDYTIQNGVVLITSKDAVERKSYTRAYDIRDLLFEIKDFPGPDISLAEAGGDGAGIGAIFEDSNDSSGQDITQPDVIIEIVQENVAPYSWDKDDIGMRFVGGHLIVRQTYEVHLEVERMLDMLRAYK